METGVLIILIDSFPYRYLNRISFPKRFPVKIPLTPCFGYSINIKAELFSGSTADELGFFNEWGYKEPYIAEKWLGFRAAKSYLGMFRKRSPFIDKALHYTISKVLKKDVANIPFEFLNTFERKGVSIYSDSFPRKTIFSEFDIERVAYEEVSPQDKQTDEYIYKLAIDKLKNASHIYVSFCDLDSIGHIFGVGSEEYERKVEKLDKQINFLVDRFLEEYPRGDVVILSDHGMVNVIDTVNPSYIVSDFTGKDNYYFVDATMCRIWFRKNKDHLTKTISTRLEKMDFGKSITPKERAEFGISSPEFGDIVFVLDGGYVFSPNFFGTHSPKAAHGYHPRVWEQKGMLLYTGNKIHSLDDVNRTIHVYPFLTRILISGDK